MEEYSNCLIGKNKPRIWDCGQLDFNSSFCDSFVFRSAVYSHSFCLSHRCWGKTKNLFLLFLVYTQFCICTVCGILFYYPLGVFPRSLFSHNSKRFFLWFLSFDLCLWISRVLLLIVCLTRVLISPIAQKVNE